MNAVEIEEALTTSAQPFDTATFPYAFVEAFGNKTSPLQHLRNGNPIVLCEWFLVPLFIIDDVIEKVKDGTIANCTYDVSKQEIKENRGYPRGGDFKLYCTVSTQVRNSQGLQFLLDQQADRLIETSSKAEVGDFAVWLMADLRKRLVEKHAETFWVSAKSHLKEGNEFFEFQKVVHTKKPIASQFDILVEQDSITMDHLIKRVSSGRVSEKGPLFKIESSALEMLFPPSQTYDLQVNYRARDGQIAFKEEEPGKRYKLNTRMNDKGKPVFLGATKLEP